MTHIDTVSEVTVNVCIYNDVIWLFQCSGISLCGWLMVRSVGQACP